jgi:hypothetical protein
MKERLGSDQRGRFIQNKSEEEKWRMGRGQRSMMYERKQCD